MAKFKNKIDRKRQRISGKDRGQLKEIDKRIRKIEYKDILGAILLVLSVILLIGTIVYAGISIFNGKILFDSWE